MSAKETDLDSPGVEPKVDVLSRSRLRDVACELEASLVIEIWGICLGNAFLKVNSFGCFALTSFTRASRLKPIECVSYM